MSMEEASLRESRVLEDLAQALAERRRLDATLAVYTDHPEPYLTYVRNLVAAAQAYEIAAQELLRRHVLPSSPA